MNEITRILSTLEQGDSLESERLLPLFYDELRKLATSRLKQEKPGQTLEATALVHEGYLRLVGPEASQRWANRAHFFAAAAEAMRRIFVKEARRKQSQKRGGTLDRQDLEEGRLPFFLSSRRLAVRNIPSGDHHDRTRDRRDRPPAASEGGR